MLNVEFGMGSCRSCAERVEGGLKNMKVGKLKLGPAFLLHAHGGTMVGWLRRRLGELERRLDADPIPSFNQAIV